MATRHVTTVQFTGCGCRARCLQRGCHWTGPNRMSIPALAWAWHQAQTDASNHASDQLREDKRKEHQR